MGLQTIRILSSEFVQNQPKLPQNLNRWTLNLHCAWQVWDLTAQNFLQMVWDMGLAKIMGFACILAGNQLGGHPDVWD